MGEEIKFRKVSWGAAQPPRAGSESTAGTDSGQSTKEDAEQQPSDCQAAIDGVPADPDAEQLARGGRVLARYGVRLMEIDGQTTVGIWSDLDRPKIRQALKVFGSDKLPVRYLDAANTPLRFKERRVYHDQVATPWNVLYAMIENPAEPWEIRDRKLRAMGLINVLGEDARCGSWAEWCRRRNARIFQRDRSIPGETQNTEEDGKRSAEWWKGRAAGDGNQEDHDDGHEVPSLELETERSGRLDSRDKEAEDHTEETENEAGE
jgi:hypothetical protein